MSIFLLVLSTQFEYNTPINNKTTPTEQTMQHYDPNANIDFLVKVETMVKQAQEELYKRWFDEVRHDTHPDIVEWFNDEKRKLENILKAIHS